MENFKTKIEFERKFPSKIFICSACKKLTTNPYICEHCNEQSNKIFETQDTYKYKIADGPETQIFKPLELSKEIEK